MAPRKKSEQNRHFARALKELRARKGWTQADLAGHLGVTTGRGGQLGDPSQRRDGAENEAFGG